MEFLARNQPDVLAYRKARPGSTEMHVEHIASQARLDGIPFCAQCKDWHRKKEPHTPLVRSRSTR